MRMVRPKLQAPTLSIAEEQEEYKPVTAAIVRHPLYEARPALLQRHDRSPEHPDVIEANSLVLCFQPDPDERARIAAGEGIYLSVLTFLKPLQPVILTVGAQATAEIYGIEVEP